MKGKGKRGRREWFEEKERVSRRLGEVWKGYFRVKHRQMHTIPPCELETSFFHIFEQNHVISFRLPIPKALNKEGEALLTQARLWLLWCHVLVNHRQAGLELVMRVLRAGKEVARPAYLLAAGARSLQLALSSKPEEVEDLSIYCAALSLEEDCKPQEAMLMTIET